MNIYEPNYTLNNKMQDEINIIMEKLDKIDNYNNLKNKNQFKKNNKIRSIYANLKLDNFPLSFEDFKEKLNQKQVKITEKETIFVKNMYKAYEIIYRYDCYKLRDFRRIHRIMLENLSERGGKFRIKEEIANDEHFLSSCDRMTPIMNSLFDFIEQKKNEIHPLILSSIAHYEIMTIKPYSEANGETARLWQIIMLYNWEEIFEYFPLEMQLEKYKTHYYETINECYQKNDSTTFIEFMLKMINKILDNLIRYIEKQKIKEISSLKT